MGSNYREWMPIYFDLFLILPIDMEPPLTPGDSLTHPKMYHQQSATLVQICTLREAGNWIKFCIYCKRPLPIDALLLSICAYICICALHIVQQGNEGKHKNDCKQRSKCDETQRKRVWRNTVGARPGATGSPTVFVECENALGGIDYNIANMPTEGGGLLLEQSFLSLFSSTRCSLRYDAQVQTGTDQEYLDYLEYLEYPEYLEYSISDVDNINDDQFSTKIRSHSLHNHPTDHNQHYGHSNKKIIMF